MTRRLDRPLCPLGCESGYLPAGVTTDGEVVERRPCPHCQATRIDAMARAREALGPDAIANSRRRFGNPATGTKPDTGETR